MGLFGPMTPYPPRGSVGRNFLEANPDAAYEAFLNQNNLSFNPSNYAQYARHQSGESYDLYRAALSSRPDPGSYDYVDFLSDWGPKLSGMFQDLTPTQRGERYGTGLGRSRWVGFAS